MRGEARRADSRYSPRPLRSAPPRSGAENILARDAEEPVEARPGFEYIIPMHMYSVIAANAQNKMVTLANPHSTGEAEEFTISYKEFVDNFRRLAGRVGHYDVT